MQARIENSDPQLRMTFENLFGLAIAGSTRGLHKHLEYTARQLFADRADEEGVLAWGRILGIARLEAQRASGIVTGTGGIAAPLPAGTELKNAADILYRTINAETADGSGNFTEVEIEALELGGDANLGAGSIVKLVSAVPDVDSDFTVEAAPNEIDGGLDLEDLEDYRIRVLERFSNPPQGGASGDFITFAKQIAGVTRAWEQENALGFGTVRVYFVRDDDLTIIPSAAEVQEVQDHLQETDGSGFIIGGVAPIFVATTVNAPTTVDLDITVDVRKATGFTDAEADTSIEEAIDDLLFELTAPNSTLRISQIREAISGSPAEVFHTMSLPAADVVTASNEILVRGTVDITYI